MHPFIYFYHVTWNAKRLTVMGNEDTKLKYKIVAHAHMGTTFLVEGVKNFFTCVHGSKMALEEVLCLAAVARVKGGGFLHIKENNCFVLNKKFSLCFMQHFSI